MTVYFTRLTLGNKNHKEEVSAGGCLDVADFRVAIKMKFSPDLDSYACHHLTLFKPDGTTEIDPGEEIGMLSEFQVGEWNPLVVRVHEKPQGTGGSEETLMFKRVVSCGESCIKYLDAVASHIF